MVGEAAEVKLVHVALNRIARMVIFHNEKKNIRARLFSIVLLVRNYF